MSGSNEIIMSSKTDRFKIIPPITITRSINCVCSNYAEHYRRDLGKTHISKFFLETQTIK